MSKKKQQPSLEPKLVSLREHPRAAPAIRRLKAYGGLVGFANVAWDGGVHAFILDTLVTERAQHHGVGTRLVAIAAEEAKAAGCEWLHVDFEDHLRPFYFGSCGFTPTNAGLIPLFGPGS